MNRWWIHKNEKCCAIFAASQKLIAIIVGEPATTRKIRMAHTICCCWCVQLLYIALPRIQWPERMHSLFECINEELNDILYNEKMIKNVLLVWMGSRGVSAVSADQLWVCSLEVTTWLILSYVNKCCVLARSLWQECYWLGINHSKGFTSALTNKASEVLRTSDSCGTNAIGSEWRGTQKASRRLWRRERLKCCVLVIFVARNAIG